MSWVVYHEGNLAYLNKSNGGEVSSLKFFFKKELKGCNLRGNNLKALLVQGVEDLSFEILEEVISLAKSNFNLDGKKLPLLDKCRFLSVILDDNSVVFITTPDLSKGDTSLSTFPFENNLFTSGFNRHETNMLKALLGFGLTPMDAVKKLKIFSESEIENFEEVQL